MAVSVNAMFADGKTRRIKSQRYAEWIVEAGWELKRQRPAKVVGMVDLMFEHQLLKDGRHRDASNFCKGPEDLLVSHGVIQGDDERYVREVRSRWSEDVVGTRVTVIPIELGS
jgi:Holliday junction resolvase RusA-like endonuclease